VIDVIYVIISIEVEYNVSANVCKEQRLECVRGKDDCMPMKSIVILP
jgi:hypothetical protein